MSVIDFEQDAAQDQVFDMENSKPLAEQVKKLQDLNNAIVVTEEQVKELKRQADKISQEVIPTMMQEMNLASLKLADGSALEVKPTVLASIWADKKDEAYKWLQDNGYGELIKNEITVAFGTKENAKAQQYAVLAQGQGFEPSQKLKVEPSTLRGMIRERIEAGLDVPSDIFNVFSGHKTKITKK
tara:strand:- start:7446 stop:8000 length:555 start_codon:yes stop_codon:yes gene_type:complete